ncbi:two-component regulator propeller domain-containing protein [Aquimarina gracilis]|uniref:Two-component regulator propeller domain-containing protein n=1 Tax=Aquimarina gracilis TaxID=874422 RepID=A0ABU5ZTL2_9FLAO|nr:two-component regulator propeller domain-containing protein [Aquimarina gracilis]MEB3345126.1 two-component regulator propeller domain-containing protein [Aquimarina gracilis]
MKKTKRRFRIGIFINPLLLFSIFITSCSGQDKKNKLQNNTFKKDSIYTDPTKKNNTSTLQDDRNPLQNLNVEDQMMLVLRRIFQDTKGNIWFVGDNILCYNGDTLVDLSNHDVFHKTVVRQIKEDERGNIWFGSSDGIIKYDPLINPNIGSTNFLTERTGFIKFTKEDGLIDNDVWSLAIDNKGTLWVGTLEGVDTFDGTSFCTFPIPESEPDTSRGVTSAKIVHSIIQDSKGNIWFGTNGGAYIYDPSNKQKVEKITLTHISKEDGLCGNTVNDILEDRSGNIWFATHHKGVCFWDGTSFTHITNKVSIKGGESWSLYEDKSGTIWFPIEHAGIYSYDGKSFNNFYKKDGLELSTVHSVIEDNSGIFWFGGFGGLYRYDGKSFVNVTVDYSWKNGR